MARLRALARSALARFGVEHARLTLLRHEQNTTFRIDADRGPWVLRISRAGVHTPETVASEMAWLRALRADTDLVVPEPMTATDGSAVVVIDDPGVPDPRICVLLRWLDGRFVDRRLTPTHLRRVARLQAGLQEHGARWSRTAAFLRPRLDTLTNAAKASGMASSASAAESVDKPSREDADRSLRLIGELMSGRDAAVCARALKVAWATTRELDRQPGTTGLIHGDLHQENYLFHRGEARAIDFDDCGWGFYLYDLAVTVSEIEGRPGSDELRAALLDEYGRLRPVPERPEAHLAALAILRRMQLLLWILESREHAAFRDDWRSWSKKELRGLAAALDATARGR